MAIDGPECTSPLSTGYFCDEEGVITRFYYDTETESCEEFSYAGCGGNENNYMSIEECQESCLG